MKTKQMDNVITSTGFDAKSKKNKKVDAAVIKLINEYSALNPGIPVKSLLRNLLLEVLPERIRRKQAEKVKTA